MIVFLLLSTITSFGFGHSNVNVELHEFHLSKCQIDYNNDENTLEISIQLFIDDLELAMNRLGYTNLGLSTEHEDSLAEQYILTYLIEHLVIEVDNEPLDLSWIGKEPSDDLAGLWCYLVVDNVFPQKVLDVSNNVLMEVFDDQKNIVKLQINPNSKAYFLFSNEESSGTLTIVP